MTSNPKVSIIIPIWGVERYIERCAKSLFEQSFDSIEYIFVNDCTPDNSIQILHDIIELYPNRKNNIRIINHDKNKGVLEARHTGIRHASGDYIIHCDSDDWVDNNWIEALYKETELKGADLVWCDYFKNFSDDQEIRISMATALEKSESLKSVLSTERIGSLWSSLVKRNIVTHKDIIPAKGNYGEDVMLIMQYIIYCKKQAYLNNAFYHYRVNNQSITQNQDKEIIYRNMESMIEHNKMIQDICASNGFLKVIKPVSLGRMFRAKDKILQLYSNDSEAAKAWKKFHSELSYFNLIESNLSVKQKIYGTIIFSGLYPVVNKLYNIRKRLVW